MPPEGRSLPLNFWENSRGSTKNLQSELLSVIPIVQGVYRQVTKNPDFNVAINAGQEWHHGHKLMSLHHAGYAIDFQTILLPGGGAGQAAQAIEKAVRTALGAKYRVELEKKPPHLHVELRGGLRISNPGDFPDPGPVRTT